MKATVLNKPGANLVLYNNIVLPELGKGQLLVKLHYSGVCHSKVMEAKGLRGEDKYIPHLLGHEGSATVLKMGAGITKVKEKQRVILSWIKGKGRDVPSVKYIWKDSVINTGAVTTFNEYAVVSENRVTPLPDGLPLDIAVLFGCAIPTGAGIVMNHLKPKKIVALLWLVWVELG